MIDLVTDLAAFSGVFRLHVYNRKETHVQNRIPPAVLRWEPARQSPLRYPTGRNTTQTFLKYVAAFEAACENDEWTRLRHFFHEDAVYEARNVSFACVLEGQAEILSGFQRSVNGFDRHMLSRKLRVLSPPSLFGERLQTVWRVSYTMAQTPPVHLVGTSSCAAFDGRIVHLVDTYHPGQAEAFQAWINQFGAHLDPSYRDGPGG